MSEIRFIDTTLRDGQQSLWALGMRAGVDAASSREDGWSRVRLDRLLCAQHSDPQIGARPRGKCAALAEHGLKAGETYKTAFDGRLLHGVRCCPARHSQVVTHAGGRLRCNSYKKVRSLERLRRTEAGVSGFTRAGI